MAAEGKKKKNKQWKNVHTMGREDRNRKEMCREELEENVN